MKKYIIFLLFSVIIQAQEGVKKVNSSSVGNFRAYIVKSISMGDNHFNKDFNNNFTGFGVKFAPLYIYNIAPVASYEFQSFKGKNNINYANGVNRLNLNLYSLGLEYKYQLNDEIVLLPIVSYVWSIAREKGSGQDYGKQDGIGFKIGTDVGFALSNSVSLLAGLEYHALKYEVNTIAQLQDYFSKYNQINFKIGFLFN